MTGVDIVLREWSFANIDSRIVLTGIADNHPKLGKNIVVAYTSEIWSISYLNEHKLACKTQNSTYICDYKYVDINRKLRFCREEYTDVQEEYNEFVRFVKYANSKARNNERFNKLLEWLAIGQKELQEQSIKEDENLIKEASKHDKAVYIDLSSISRGNKLAFNINGNTGVIKPKVHEGNIIDAVIYENANGFKDKILFEYAIGTNSLFVNKLARSIDYVVIHNNKCSDIIINGTETIKANEIRKLCRDDIVRKNI